MVVPGAQVAGAAVVDLPVVVHQVQAGAVVVARVVAALAAEVAQPAGVSAVEVVPPAADSDGDSS